VCLDLLDFYRWLWIPPTLAMATQQASESISKPELVATTSYTKEIPTEVGRTHIHLRPHESYEGAHRWDPEATWTPEEEAKVVRKTDLTLLTW